MNQMSVAVADAHHESRADRYNPQSGQPRKMNGVNMADSSRALYEQLKATNSLPTPTGVAMEILRVTNDDNCTLDEVASVVELDPAVAAKLLKFVNSPLAALSRQIVSISKAVGLLGLHAVKSIALGFSIMAQRPEHCTGFDHDEFWSECVARAVTARHAARELRNFAPDEAFTCALLCQTGRLAFAAVAPAQYAQVMHEWTDKDDEAKLSELEKARFEINHSALAAEMMADWHLPEVFCDAVRYQDDPSNGEIRELPRSQQLARIIKWGGMVSQAMLNPSVSATVLDKIIDESGSLGISPDDCQRIFNTARQDWASMGSIFEVGTREVLPFEELIEQARTRRDDLLTDDQIQPPSPEAIQAAR